MIAPTGCFLVDRGGLLDISRTCSGECGSAARINFGTKVGW